MQTSTIACSLSVIKENASPVPAGVGSPHSNRDFLTSISDIPGLVQRKYSSGTGLNAFSVHPDNKKLVQKQLSL